MTGERSGWDRRRLAADGPSDDDRELYRRLSGEAAKSVAVIAAVHRGRDIATTVIDHLSVSYDPPTVLVSLHALSRMAEAVDAAGRWSLSLLSSEQRSVAEWLGEPGTPLEGLLEPVRTLRPADGSPCVVDGSLAWFEARTVAVHAAATHQLLVGEVVAMGRAAELGTRPLLRFRSGYLSC